MATVRTLVGRVARGDLSVQEAARDFESRHWPARPEPTDEQLYGLGDQAPPTDNSVDWIELEPDLTDGQRETLRRAYDRAVRGA